MSQSRTVLRVAKRLRSAQQPLQLQRAASSSAAAESSTSSSSSSSSSSSPAIVDSWQRPIAEGSNPAYDHALTFLDSQSSRLLSRASTLRTRASQLTASDETKGAIRSLKERARALEMKANLDDPRVRWAFEHAGGKATGSEDERDLFSVLAQDKWVNEGALDLLMQRLTTMHVVPDILPPFKPTMDMSISYTSESSKAKTVVPGEYLFPSETFEAPQISVQPFMTSAQTTKYFTLVMVDADCPDPATYGFKQYAHWIVPNIPVDASTDVLPTSSLPALLPYHPPHPSIHTPYHRYTFLLIRQPSSLPLESFQTPASRAEFDLKEWVQASGFEGSVESLTKAAGMFREGGKKFGSGELSGREKLDMIEKEEDVVSKIYEEILAETEPIWKKAPKEVRYGNPSERAAVEEVADKIAAGSA